MRKKISEERKETRFDDLTETVAKSTKNIESVNSDASKTSLYIDDNIFITKYLLHNIIIIPRE